MMTTIAIIEHEVESASPDRSRLRTVYTRLQETALSFGVIAGAVDNVGTASGKLDLLARALVAPAPDLGIFYQVRIAGGQLRPEPNGEITESAWKPIPDVVACRRSSLADIGLALAQSLPPTGHVAAVPVGGLIRHWSCLRSAASSKGLNQRGGRAGKCA